MKLQGLKVHGFKSFADSTEIEFHDGITAIVGPNGCGKSNISDAIRWVLGEQRPTAIRGAKMEEAIFQGTVHRRPVNRGTVALSFTNADRALPVPYDEVELGRTVYRDGGSEYSINRSSCRLKDVVDLCRDTGLGANAYAVIENRMIDAILSDRTEERRSLFEEAAGIGRYKDRRRGALRRLERAEADLQRLDDVIGEVETKVRSLARQRGKAERYTELRARRLSVEVSVVEHQIIDLRERLDGVRAQLGQGDLTGEGMAAALAAAESHYETLRLRQVEVEKDRTEAGGRLEAVREELGRIEREIAVAEERRVYANRRLSQIDTDRIEGRARSTAIDQEMESLTGKRASTTEELEGLRIDFEACRTTTEEVRNRLVAARSELESVEGREREVTRKRAQLEIDSAAADAQAAELERRAEQITQELESTRKQLVELEDQGDLFSDRLNVLQSKVDAARAVVAEVASRVQAEREALEEARAREMTVLEKASSAQARLNALEALHREQAGVEPTVRAILEASPDGVLGLLTDFITAPPEFARMVDAHLGALAKSVVVRDRAAAERVAGWFEEEWEEGGGLILLPLDRVPEEVDTSGDLLESVEATGAGAPWVRALLGGVQVVDQGALLADSSGRHRLSTTGWSVDARGVMRIGNPQGDVGVLERQERMKALAEEVETSEAETEEARTDRSTARERVTATESELEEAREALSILEVGLRDAQVEVASQVDRKDRMGHRQVELERQLEGTVTARERAIERGRSARETRARLTDEEESVREVRRVARESVAEVEQEWETARIEESRLSIEVARLEGELSRIDARMSDATSERERARQRIAALDDEEQQLRTELASSDDVLAAGRSKLQELFGHRDEALDAFREKERIVSEVGELVAEAERSVRETRSAERGAAERRHRLELEQQELVGRMDRIRDRLEAEWGRPLEVLVEQAEPVEGEPEELSTELAEIVEKLARIGPVNMLAVEEHAEESERLAFLTEQRDDLLEARDGLRTAIRQINETATTLFMETFDAIRENFRETFLRLFQGGEADLWMADPDDPLESPIEILASPRGKRTQRIDLLSGGERALTALSLLFGIYLVKPSPFCVLDEVDAPLDESNIGRFIKLLQDFKDQTQFVVITHNPRTIEAADWIYGVTMEEPGVSSIVGVRLEEALEAAGAGA